MVTLGPVQPGALERGLGMLVLDAALCERFFLNPSAAVSPIEIHALARLRRVAIARFRDSLEPGLRGHRTRNSGSPP